MRVILTERVKTLGSIGEIVNVSPGYARNFLVPKNYAVYADDKNVKDIEVQRRKLAKKISEQHSEAGDAQKKIEGITFEYSKKASATGKLFGTITPTQLVKDLEEKGVSVNKRQIVITRPIKSLGKFDVLIKLSVGVEAKIFVNVTMDLKQAEELKKKQEIATKRAKSKKKDEEKAEDKVEKNAVAEVTEGKEEENTCK